MIAIDGPAGSGKSTVAKALAQELGLSFLDSGAMYRAVTLAVIEHDVDPMDAEGCARIARALSLEFDAQGRIQIDGRPGEPAIRSETVTKAVSAVSAHSEVRAAIVPQQRAEAVRRGGLVADGRDMGSVVFPQADYKFFLTASPEVRAKRRAHELHEQARFAEILADMQLRDHLDSSRKDSPLLCAPDAIPVETSSLDAQGVVRLLLARVRKDAKS
ncbi:MAG: (d)CMP kinase [Planctomycetes bacterium]|nr:(d)CMP kinase [Planctomycetota bacterium]